MNVNIIHQSVGPVVGGVSFGMLDGVTATSNIDITKIAIAIFIGVSVQFVYQQVVLRILGLTCDCKKKEK